MTNSTILDQIRLTEKEAAQLISKAHEDAQTSQEAARLEIAGYLDEARAEAARICQTILADAEEQAKAIASEAASASDMHVREITGSVEGRLDQAAQVVSERIVSLSVDR